MFHGKKLSDLFVLIVQVQSKVNLKYDSWHKEVLSKFGQMLGQNMTEFHSQISKVRTLSMSISFDLQAPIFAILPRPREKAIA